MSYHAVIEPSWCQENRYFFPSSVGLALSDYGQSTFESEYLFLNCSRMWNGFLCLLGQHSSVHREVQGCCPLAVAREPSIPWRSHGAGCCWSHSSPLHRGLAQGLPPKTLPRSGWCSSVHFWSKVVPIHLQAVSFHHLSTVAVMTAPTVVAVAAVSQSRPDFTCAQVQHFPFPFLARSWQLPEPILWTFAQIC